MNKQQYMTLDKRYHLPKEIHPSVVFGKNVTIGIGCIIEEDVVIGDNVFIGHHTLIRPRSRVASGAGLRSFVLLDPEVEIGELSQVYPHSTVGGGTIIGRNVYYGPYCLTTNSSEPGVLNPPRIEDNVIIYAGCMIGPGVVIGEGAIVGMGSNVTKSIPARQVWYGEAAKYRRDVVKKDYGLSEEDDWPWPYSILDYHDDLNEHNKNKREEENPVYSKTTVKKHTHDVFGANAK